MDYFDWFAKRISALRIQKGVSARDMSLSLGQSESYINKIENKKTLPSMSGLFYICEYFEISPRDFFDTEIITPKRSSQIAEGIKRLTPEQAEHILQIICDLTHKNDPTAH